MNDLYTFLKGHAEEFHPVVEFDQEKEKLTPINLSNLNIDLQSVNIKDTEAFETYISSQLKKGKAKFGIGGYNEDRQVYARSTLFNGALNEFNKHDVRTIHLGIDIWGEAGTEVFTPLGGMVHSVAYNNNFGDYGPTIIMQHQLQTRVFYLIYGHLSLKSIAVFQPGNYLARGEQVGIFGELNENGNWPPHLHFQIIDDIGNWNGDYPGVCSKTERKNYLLNSPDPDCVLNLLQYSSYS
jgi:murein DD-endopeptidase MepM/ murein hydrolase activator NlpD